MKFAAVMLVSVMAVTSFAAPRQQVIKTVKADTVVTIKTDTIKTVKKTVKVDTVVTYKYDTIKAVRIDTLKIAKMFNDTAILVKQDTAKANGKPVVIKKK